MSFLLSLENPNYPLLGPTLRGLKLWRIWRPSTDPIKLSYYFIHVFGLGFVISEYVELWIIRSNIELALRNLSVTMLSSICMVKSISFICWQKDWQSVIDYVSDLEKRQLAKKDYVTSTVIEKYTHYSRNITYLYWGLVTATVITVILAPLCGFLTSSEHRYLIRNGSAPYPEILSSWLPFDRTQGFGYWVSVIEHSAICIYGGGVVANYDSNAVVLMSFFYGQLELLNENCIRLFGEANEVVDPNEAVKRIEESHNHHVDLVKFSSIFNTLLSPVMFVYVIICSLMICASAIQLTTEGTGTMQRIWISEYLLALIAQLFLYCWHSNEVLHMSNTVEEGIYKSAWWSQNVRIRRSVLLLGGQLRRPIIFKAGPFTNLSVPTFVANGGDRFASILSLRKFNAQGSLKDYKSSLFSIMKGSYSYYTLLSQKKD